MTGIKYSDYNGANCGTDSKSQSCNNIDCCSSVYYVDGTTCSKTCGGGTYNRLAYSNYTKQRCSSSDRSSGGSSCNTQPCCSESNPTGCPKKHACRNGNTHIFNIPDTNKALGGTVPNTQPLYIIGETSNMYYVFAPKGYGFYYNTTNPADYGYDSKLNGYYVYIYKNCIADWTTSCESYVCPG